MAILQSLLSWSTGRPLWQQDALRRLIDQSALSEGDIADLAALCRIDAGGDNPHSITAVPPLFDGDASAQHGAPAVVLEDISQLKNVNALRPGQTLTIAANGLTVVYGENGAGKSGYVRVIKQLCRTRGEHETVYPNVYAADGDAAQATLRYRVNLASHAVVWGDGCEKPGALQQVSIFDSRAASVYVTAENNVAYLPYGMDLFPRLAAVIDRVRGHLEFALANLQRQRETWAEIATDTQVFEQLRHLGAKGARDRLDSLAKLSVADTELLETLRSKDKKYRSDDAAAQAKAFRHCAGRLRSLLARITAAEAALDDSAASGFKAAHEALQAARHAAEMATASAFGGDPGHGAGTQGWRLLWEAAKKYAAQFAPAVTFPPDAGMSCLLCQQPIGVDAAARMRAFEEFVRGEAQRAVAIANAVLAEKRDALAKVTPSSIADATLLAEVESLDADVAEALRDCLAGLASRHTALLGMKSSGDCDCLPAVGAKPAPKLLPLINSVENQAAVFEAAESPDERNAVECALRELEARATLGSLLDKVYAEIDREAECAILARAIRSATTNAVTKKNGELLAEAITAPLAVEFDRQLKALGLTHIPISLSGTRGQKGHALHGLKLGQKLKKAIAANGVLSEGEHRGIALAAFFSEVELQESSSTLVLDDPVSSVDHARRKYVANQIARLAQKRPVLVFTHDLVFLWMLQGAADDRKVAVQPRLFRRDATGAGIIATDFPWDGQKVNTRIGTLKQVVVGLKGWAATDRPRYEGEIRLFYGKLRDTWERAVEEVLFAGAIRRFDVDVQTKPLRRLHAVTEAQLERLEAGMSKASSWVQGHDHSPEFAAQLPEPDEAEKDLEELDSWVKEIRAVHKGKSAA